MAIAKHGSEAFTFEIVESGLTTRNEANERERHWIKECRSYERDFGYNGTPGGDGGPTFLGRKHTDEYKRHMSEVQRNRSPEWQENFRHAQQNRSEEWKKNISIAQQNRPPVADSTRQKMSEAWQRRKARGWTASEETRQRISRAHKGKSCPSQTRDSVSDARKFRLLQQDVAITEGTLNVSARALKRHHTRMKKNFWENYKFKHPVVEQSALVLRQKLQHIVPDLA